MLCLDPKGSTAQSTRSIRVQHHVAGVQVAPTGALRLCAHSLCNGARNGLHRSCHASNSNEEFGRSVCVHAVHVMQIIQVVSLHLLFAATAFLAAGREYGEAQTARPTFDEQHASPLDAFAALWHGAQV